MNNQFTQPNGSTTIAINKQILARKFGVKASEVTYAIPGVVLSQFKVIYDKATQKAWSLPKQLDDTAVLVSLVGATMTQNKAPTTQDLAALAVQRNEWNLVRPASFIDGATIYYANDILMYTGQTPAGFYRWAGTIPGTGLVVASGSTPTTSGGVSSTGWVPVDSSSLMASIGGPDGARYVGRCANVVLLRATEPLVANQRIELAAWTINTKTGGGFFQYDSGDSTTPDDGGLVFVTAGGKRWKRVLDYPYVTVSMFGANGNGVAVEDASFSAAAKAAPSSNLAGVSKSAAIPRPNSSIVYVDNGTFLLNDYIDVGNKDVTWILSHGTKITNPQYLNGRVVREGRQQNMYPSGSAGNVTGLSVRLQKIGEDLTDNPEVLGITDASRLATYPDRDMAAIYGEAKLPPALTTLTGTTFTATSVTFTNTLDSTTRKTIRVGMIIDTVGTKYSGVVTGWSADFQTINVSAWYLYSGPGTGATPTAGLTAVVNAFTKGWGLNINAQLDSNSYADYCVAAEFSVVNNKAYNVNCWGMDIVNLGTYKLGTLMNLRGSTAGSLYGCQITAVDTALNINNVNTAYLTGVDANDVQISLGKNTYTFGKANTGAVQTINFRTSGEGSAVNDSIIQVSGSRSAGTATIRLNSTFTQTAIILPATDNTFSNGTGSNRWTALYSTNGTVQTSDGRLKDIEEISEAEIEVGLILSKAMIKYTWASKSPDACYHFGIIAQEVMQTFEDHGLDITKYGLVTYEETSDTYGVNYSELSALCIYAMSTKLA